MSGETTHARASERTAPRARNAETLKELQRNLESQANGLRARLVEIGRSSRGEAEIAQIRGRVAAQLTNVEKKLRLLVQGRLL